MAQVPIWIVRAGILVAQIASHPAMKLGMVVISAIDDLARVISRRGQSAIIS